MIDKEAIDKAILELEENDTTYSNCERLAWLYIVRDHIPTQTTQTQPSERQKLGDTEFLRAANGKSASGVLQILDELMEATKVLHPRMYDQVISRLKDL